MSNSQFEKAVEVTAQFYAARRTLRAISEADHYRAEIADWQQIIRTEMKRSQCGALTALMGILLRIARKSHAIGGLASMWAMAAYVEMVEPTPEPSSAEKE